MTESAEPNHVKCHIISQPPTDHEIRHGRVKMEIQCRVCGGDGRGTPGGRWSDRCCYCDGGWREYTVTSAAFLAAFAEDEPPVDAEP